MLKKRVITAIILLLAVSLGIIYLPLWGFATVAAALLAVGAWEWAGLVGLSCCLHKAIYVMVFLLLLIIPAVQSCPLLGFAVIGWFFIAIWVGQYPIGKSIWQAHLILRLFAGWGVLIPCWVALLLLRQQTDGILLVFLLLATVACADSGAYFAGRFLGRKPLAAAISPNKTQEGVYGGLLCALLVTMVLGWFWLGSKVSFPLYTVLILATAVLSVLGDLFESMVKRMAEVKDSGFLFPGHGGVLDRIDGLTAAAPLFALGMLLLL